MKRLEKLTVVLFTNILEQVIQTYGLVQAYFSREMSFRSSEEVSKSLFHWSLILTDRRQITIGSGNAF